MPSAWEARLTQLNKKITEQYDKPNTEAQKRIKPLSLSDLCDCSEQYPCLKHQKAARIRNFAPVAEGLATEHSVARKKTSQHRLAVASKVAGLYQLLDSKWQDWPKRHQQFINEVMHHYSWLAADALASGKHLWSLLQKSHLIFHLASQSTLHPSLTWTYGSESFMGWMVLLHAHMGHQVTKCQRKFVKNLD